VLTLPLLNQAPKIFNLPPFYPSEVLFLCLLSACILKLIFNKKKVIFFRSAIDLPIIIFALVLISSFLSTSITHFPIDYLYIDKVIGVLKRLLFIHNPYDYSYIFKSTLKILEGISLFFIVTNFINKKRVLNRIYFFLILGWGIAVILGFVQYFGGVLGNEQFPTRMFSMFDNPNLFGGYLILIFPLGVFYAINKCSLKKISLLIFAMLSIVALILSRSKNSWIAFAILLIFMGTFLSIFNSRHNYKTFIKSLNWKWICVCAISFMIIFFLFNIYLKKENGLGLLGGFLNWNTLKSDIRFPLWKYTIQVVEDFPLWGVGVGEFTFIFQKYSLGHTFSKVECYQAHNYFLQIAAEMGLIGLYAFLWILWRIVIKGLYIMRGKQDFIKLGLWFGIIGFISTFFGDGYLWSIEMQLLFWLFIALLFVDVDNTDTEETQTHPNPFAKKLLIGLSLILLIMTPLQIYHKFQFSFLPEKTVGLYKEVFKEEGREYRWGEKVVLIPVDIKGKYVNIPIWFGNPDIREKPVKVEIYINKKLVDSLEFNDHHWHILRYFIKDTRGPEMFLKIKASRTWNPYLVEGRLYPWDLGPAIGEIFWSS
jgi:putative inorganic carbon (HCO3(-)) transporter